MAEINIDIALESTSQEILTATQAAKTAAENANSAVIEVGGFKSPIKILAGEIEGGTTITGTGKGKLQYYVQSNYATFTVTVDGVTSPELTPYDDSGWLQIEFAESYSLNQVDGVGSYFAMFY